MKTTGKVLVAPAKWNLVDTAAVVNVSVKSSLSHAIDLGALLPLHGNAQVIGPKIVLRFR